MDADVGLRRRPSQRRGWRFAFAATAVALLAVGATTVARSTASRTEVIPGSLPAGLEVRHVEKAPIPTVHVASTSGEYRYASIKSLTRNGSEHAPADFSSGIPLSVASKSARLSAVFDGRDVATSEYKLLVDWDDQTVVLLTSFGLARDELTAIAQSLRPGSVESVESEASSSDPQSMLVSPAPEALVHRLTGGYSIEVETDKSDPTTGGPLVCYRAHKGELLGASLCADLVTSHAGAALMYANIHPQWGNGLVAIARPNVSSVSVEGDGKSVPMTEVELPEDSPVSVFVGHAETLNHSWVFQARDASGQALGEMTVEAGA